jgi:hypothetical protein
MTEFNNLLSFPMLNVILLECFHKHINFEFFKNRKDGI